MENKKSVLFVCYGLGIGGIERALVNLLNEMPETEFDVDLLVMNPEYALRDQIRRKVTYLDPFLYTLFNLLGHPSDLLTLCHCNSCPL
mgnify:CR=1 FL=1